MKCEIPRCRNKADLIYYGHGVCQKHYDMDCDGIICLKKEFGVKT